MNKKLLLLGSALVMAAILFNTTTVNSEISKPPAGSAGDPITGKSCAQSGCHPSPALTPSSNDLTINIGTGTPTTPLNSSFSYDGGTAYNIAFLPTAFTGRYGFQIIALDAANNMAGTFTVTNAATTAIKTAGNYKYMGHLNASSFKQWVFKWTAPPASTGDVTFYYAYNTADNDGSALGDVIYKGSVTISANPSSINDLSTKVADLTVFPNPVSGEFGLSFNATETMDATAGLYNLNGELVNNMFDETINEGFYTRTFKVSNLAAGVYMVKISSGNASTVKKIFKL
ncbi:MAG: T9SS type A sorting domain-containing protein [Chitinophagales bacterium]|nr:T9SS type A sorting domain-containing protein [Chitinophagales bacterium]